jgi:hypothetical protein
MHLQRPVCSIRVKLVRVGPVHPIFNIDRRGEGDDRVPRDERNVFGERGGGSHDLDHPFGK